MFSKDSLTLNSVNKKKTTGPRGQKPEKIQKHGEKWLSNAGSKERDGYTAYQ